MFLRDVCGELLFFGKYVLIYEPVQWSFRANPSLKFLHNIVMSQIGASKHPRLTAPHDAPTNYSPIPLMMAIFPFTLLCKHSNGAILGTVRPPKFQNIVR